MDTSYGLKDHVSRRATAEVHEGAASAAVAEMGGHVAKKLGDGLLVLFGYPTAQENDGSSITSA
jgi:class 3 adenylate cyclase